MNKFSSSLKKYYIRDSNQKTHIIWKWNAQLGL